jgi:ribonuclease HI
MHVNLYCDGGNNGKNPSPSVYWSVAREHEGGRIELLTERATTEVYHSNNAAEYLAVIDSLTHVARTDDVTSARIHSDSQLIVNQFNGKFGINDAALRDLCHVAQRNAAFLIESGIKIEIVWVPREENVRRLGH